MKGLNNVIYVWSIDYFSYIYKKKEKKKKKLSQSENNGSDLILSC